MQEHDAQSTIAALTRPLPCRRKPPLSICSSSGAGVLQRLHSVWRQLEVYEAMAYEDKVAAQVRTLDEATGSLWHLHKALVATRGNSSVTSGIYTGAHTVQRSPNGQLEQNCGLSLRAQH